MTAGTVVRCEKRSCLLALVGVLIFASPVYAQEEVAAITPVETPATPLGNLNLDAMNAPRNYVSDHFLHLVSNIDRFFGNDRNYQESNDSVLQLDLTRVTGYGGDEQYVLSGRAKLHLPNTENRLHLTIESNPDQNPAATQTPAQRQANQGSTLQSIAAALRFERGTEEHWRFSTDVGLKFQGMNTSPFARARASMGKTYDLWRVKGTETVFWFNTIGAGETTQFDAERIFSETLLFRATSNATWLDKKQSFDLSQNFSLYHAWDERTALLYQASVIGISKPELRATDHVLLFSYRYRLHRNWLFYEIAPQIHFPIDQDFRSSPALMMRLEMLFDAIE